MVDLCYSCAQSESDRPRIVQARLVPDSRATSEDVARRAGVSQSTVSRVFSNNTRISDATREKVLQAATELEYRPNTLARSLITKESQLIGVVMAGAGIQRPAFISGPQNTSTTQERSRGYFERLAAHGYAQPIQRIGDLSYDSAFAATCALMRGDEQPDGIFAASDLMALGTLDALRYELGLRVPDDIQVIGFDDIPSAARASYELTTIRIDFDLMIDNTLRILQGNLKQAARLVEQVTTPVAYVERKTLTIGR